MGIARRSVRRRLEKALEDLGEATAEDLPSAKKQRGLLTLGNLYNNEADAYLSKRELLPKEKRARPPFRVFILQEDHGTSSSTSAGSPPAVYRPPPSIFPQWVARAARPHRGAGAIAGGRFVGDSPTCRDFAPVRPGGDPRAVVRGRPSTGDPFFVFCEVGEFQKVRSEYDDPSPLQAQNAVERAGGS